MSQETLTLARAADLAFATLTAKRPRHSRLARPALEEALAELATSKLKAYPAIAIVEAIQGGFSGTAVAVTEAMLDVGQAHFASILDATPKTVRAMKEREKLDLTTSEKVFSADR